MWFQMAIKDDSTLEQKRCYLFQSLQNMSNIVGSLDIASSIIEKMNNIYSFANNASSNDPLGRETLSRAPDGIIKERVFHEKLENVSNTVGGPKTLKHSHSLSCMAKCKHAHHAEISSWKHSLSVHRSHIPLKLQEPYIEYGYLLPFMPWRYYLKALYSPSYELVNVWTHLLPALYFLYLLCKFSKEMDIINAWPLLLITFSACILGSFSAFAHLFHSRSSLHHSRWFVVDYFGITLYAFSSLTTNFYSGAPLKYFKLLSLNYLQIITGTCFFGFTCLCLTQSNQRLVSVKISRQIKVLVNGLGYLFGAVPLFLRMYENFLEGRIEPSLQLHALAILGMLLAPIVYGLDMPQRFYPGKFDVFGHSHMWFHIMTASSMLCDINAVYYDILEGPWKVISQEPDYPTFCEIVFYYCIVILYGIVCGYFTHLSIKRDFPEEDLFLQGKLLCSCGLPETMRLNHLRKTKTMPNIEVCMKEDKID